MSDISPFVGPRNRMGSGTEVMVDREHGVVVLNQSDISMSEVSGALARQHPEIAALVRWTVQTNGDSGVARQGGVFQRDRYVTPEQIFAQFRVCMDAATNDDVVSNWIETTEAMAFGRMDFQAEDEDEENVWNQIAYDLDLDSRIREMWRELCTFSQFYCVAKGQLVWTPDGPTPIEQMRRGQMVWGMGEGFRGRPGLDVARVTRVERTGVKRIYEVMTRDQTLRVSADHLVAVFCRSGNRESRSQVHTEWVRVSNLVPGDVLVSVGTMPHRRTTHTSDPSLGTARIVGMLVGDSARNPAYEPEKGPTQFKLCVPVGPQRDDCAALLSDELGCKVDVCVDRCCIRFCAPELRQWATEVMVHKSPDRFVPSWVWLASPKQQLAFLEGYLDAGGCKIARGWKIAATSQRLVRELKVLCEMLGWGASRTRPGKTSGYGVCDVWTFVAYSEPMGRQMPSSYARKGVPLDESLCGRTVVSITDTGLDEEVYDLEVPGLRSFVVEGTVVHNCVTWWGRKDYKVKGTDPKTGVKRKKTFQQVVMPLGLTILDPQKVVPVGNLMFNQEQLCYIADRTERDLLDAAVLNDPQADEVSRQIIVAKYAPPDYERRNLAMQGVNPEWLYVLNPKNVWRHTATRPQYRRFAEVRMASILELLDLKHQLRQMDRAHLIGGSLRLDQRVVTPDGWKPIGSIRVGDEVYGVDGRPTKVIGVFPQGVLDLWKVTFSDGAEVICDGNHYWTVTDRDRARRGSPARTITLNQIMTEGLWKTNGPGKRTARHRIPISAPWEFAEADLVIEPYLLGYLIGNGGLTTRTPCVTITPGDERCWEEGLPSGVHATLVEHRPGAAPSFSLSAGGTKTRRNPLTVALEHLGLMGHDAVGKFIPDEYLWASVEQRWALLQGLCDADGHSHQAGGVEYSTVSEKLADGVIQLAQSLGGVGRATVVPAHDGEQTLYRVWVSLHQEEAPFRLKRKVAKWQPRKVPYVRAIEQVERVEDGEAVCIKVARDDGLFITEHGITTHNTNFIVLVKKGTDHLPARPEEVQNLQGQVSALARMPILVGDHRLTVEIVTPKTDYTLNPDKYSTIDNRLLARLYQMFVIHGGEGSIRGDDAVKLGKVIARGMESRRFMMRRTLERQVFGPTVSANEQLTCEPVLRFHPKRIELDFDPAMVQFMMDARDRGDMSRESYLSALDLDQQDEALWRRREAANWDDVFTMTNVPFSAPGPGHNVPVGPGGKPKTAGGDVAPGGAVMPQGTAPHSHAPDGTPVDLPQLPAGKGRSRTAQKSAGRSQGGNKNGGGAAPGSGQGQAPRRGRPSSK